MKLVWSGEVTEGQRLPRAVYVHATNRVYHSSERRWYHFVLRRLLLPIPIPWRTEIITFPHDGWRVGWHFPCFNLTRMDFDPPSFCFFMSPWKTKLVSTSYSQQMNSESRSTHQEG